MTPRRPPDTHPEIDDDIAVSVKNLTRNGTVVADATDGSKPFDLNEPSASRENNWNLTPISPEIDDDVAVSVKNFTRYGTVGAEATDGSKSFDLTGPSASLENNWNLITSDENNWTEISRTNKSQGRKKAAQGRFSSTVAEARRGSITYSHIAGAYFNHLRDPLNRMNRANLDGFLTIKSW